MIKSTHSNTPPIIVDPENWSYCRYRLGDLVAYISYGAELHPQDSQLILECYYTTMQNIDSFQELFQKKCSSLDEACDLLNQHYGHWDFEDQMIASEGCGSCENH